MLLHLRVKTTFQQRNVEKGKGKSIKLFCDFSQEGAVLIEKGLLGYMSSPRREQELILKQISQLNWRREIKIYIYVHTYTHTRIHTFMVTHTQLWKII